MSSNTGTLNFKVDDANPRLVYTQGWFKGGVASEYQSTTHGTRTAGSNVTFAFNGSYVAAFGTIDQTGASYFYVLDEEDRVNMTSNGVSSPSYGQGLFARESLSDGEHTVTLGSDANGPTLWLDYFSYTGQADDSRSSADSQPPPSTTPNREGMQPAMIAAVVLVCIASLLVLIFGFVFVRHRWHRWRLSRPKEDLSAREKGFEILPAEPQLKLHVVEAIRIKLLGRRTPNPAPSGAQSSSVFTSVILNFPYSSHSGSSGVR